jgi:drug/metabolite transporter (DMT)-like permease
MSIVFSVSFGHIMKWSERRCATALWVGACNYIAASVACTALMLLAARPTTNIPFTIATGLGGGVSYLVSLLFYFTAVARLGVGPATAAIRVAVAVPVAVALLVWREPLDGAQWAGLTLVLLALPLLGRGQAGSVPGGGVLLAGVLAPLFIITGLGQLAARVYSGGAPDADRFLYLTCLFAGAAASALVALCVRPQRLQRQDVGLGLLLGAVNVLSNVCLLAALRALPSATVFTVSSSAGVTLAAVTGILVWGERLSRPAIAGVTLATAAVVLLTR